MVRAGLVGLFAAALYSAVAQAKPPEPLKGPGTEGVHQPLEGRLKDTVFSGKPMVDITSCLTDYWAKFGQTKVIDRPGGSKTFEFFLKPPAFSKASGDPTLSIEITEGERRRVHLYTTWILPKPGKAWEDAKSKCIAE